MSLCRQCGKSNSRRQNGDVCWNCGAAYLEPVTPKNHINVSETTSFSESSPIDRNGLWSDIVSFSISAFVRDSSLSYRDIGNHGTFRRILIVAIATEILTILGMILLFGFNPYIDFSYYLLFVSFDLVFLILNLTGFFTVVTIQYFSFRLSGGRGNVISHMYLVMLLNIYHLLVITAGILIGGFSEILALIVIFLGQLFVFFLWFTALCDLHQMSFIQSVGATGLAILLSSPFIVGPIFLIIFFQDALPFEIYDWRTSAILTVILIILFINLSYLSQADIKIKNRAQKYKNRQKLFSRLSISGALIALGVFLYLDTIYATIPTGRSPYHVTFLPGEANLLYVATQKDRLDGPTSVDEWNLSQEYKKHLFAVDYSVMRMRPSADGASLMLNPTEYGSPNATFFNPITKKFHHDNLHYLRRHGILNPERNEFYLTSPYEGIRIGSATTHVNSSTRRLDIDSDPFDDLIPISLPRSKPTNSVAFHPNNKFLFVLSDNHIDVLEIESHQVIDTFRLGGKLRDLAISPNGQTMYIADSLWNRIIVVPVTVLDLDLDALKVDHGSENESTSQSLIPDECNLDYPLCVHSFNIDIIGSDSLEIGLSLQPLNNTTIDTNLNFAVNLDVRIPVDDPQLNRNYISFDQKGLLFTCTSYQNTDVQECKSTTIKLYDISTYLEQAETVCVRSRIFSNMNEEMWHCPDQLQRN